MFACTTGRERASAATLVAAGALAIGALGAEVWLFHAAVGQPLAEALAKIRSPRVEPPPEVTGFHEEILVVAPRRGGGSTARSGRLLAGTEAGEAPVVTASETFAYGPCVCR